jgi:RNA polymerase sigma-70 factor, ECF subfamily
MTALASNASFGRPDLRSWLAALTERGGAVLAVRIDEAARPVAGSDHADSLDSRDVQQARNGDDRAFERIVKRHQQEIARRLRRFTSDPLAHEELVQETFVQAFLTLRGYRGEAPLIHWLHRIAVRAGYRFWRERRSRAVHTGLDSETLASPTRREPHELEEVLGRLPPRDRLVLTLMYLEERSVEETASLTGWSRTMVKVQAYRARRRLRKIMEAMKGTRP